MNEQATDLYNELKSLGLISPANHAKAIAAIKAVKSFYPPDVLWLAIHHSITDIIRVSGSHGFEEEHLTASLAGALTANLFWYAKEFRRNRGFQALPALRWIHQTKHSEGRSGIDFGILAEIPRADLGKEYRLVVIQAKVEKANFLTIEVDHVTNEKTKNFQWSENGMTVLRAGANMTLGNLERDQELIDRATEIAKQPFKRGDEQFQLETILRTDLRGRDLANSDREWCFYTGWSASRLPRTIGARAIAQTVLSRGALRPDPVELPNESLTFADLIHEAIYRKTTAFGLELSKQKVGGVVDGVFEVAPGLRLLLASASGDLKPILRPMKGQSVSGPLLTDRLAKLNLSQRIETATKGKLDGDRKVIDKSPPENSSDTVAQPEDLTPPLQFRFDGI